MNKNKNVLRLHRKNRIKVKGTKKKPRLVVFRSLQFIYGNIIDDDKGVTMAWANSREIKNQQYNKDVALATGKLLAERAKKAKITEIIFDRAGYKYHGKIKALADGARQGGLKF
jgi:large subunit ribosomal protein L18